MKNRSPSCNYNMNMKVTLDKAGRVAIPKPLRDKLAWGPGDELELKTAGEKIILRPFRAKTLLFRENGVWVYRSGTTGKASLLDETMEKLREERSRPVLG